MRFAENMMAVAIGWQVFAIRKDPLDLGLIGLAEFVPLLVLALPAGHLADHLPRRLIAALALALMVAVAVGAHRDRHRSRASSGRTSCSRR